MRSPLLVPMIFGATIGFSTSAVFSLVFLFSERLSLLSGPSAYWFERIQLAVWPSSFLFLGLGDSSLLSIRGLSFWFVAAGLNALLYGLIAILVSHFFERSQWLSISFVAGVVIASFVLTGKL